MYCTLWDIPEEDFQAYQEWIGSDLSIGEYHARLTAAAQTARSGGLKVQWLRVSLAELQDTLLDHRLPNTPEGRAQAIALCWAEKHAGGEARL